MKSVEDVTEMVEETRKVSFITCDVCGKKQEYCDYNDGRKKDATKFPDATNGLEGWFFIGRYDDFKIGKDICPECAVGYLTK